ncbi:hypothetical protein KP509_17G058400 [Ceratopteris richardii]|uniref:Uncharacterized protein n=1 Tax=Ceratopteris richardii TaxID=49495 RepID=A0A8T2SVC4_CERRI|nr:hypothetical protein KP509_17G058400 [Ceratopteris richardii]
MTDEEHNRRRCVEDEVRRLKQLPSSSAYAVHKLRVLNKILQILSVAAQARSVSAAEELELLFSSLSL